MPLWALKTKGPGYVLTRRETLRTWSPGKDAAASIKKKLTKKGAREKEGKELEHEETGVGDYWPGRGARGIWGGSPTGRKA